MITSLRLTALVGATAVIAGAFGAHALKATLLERGMLHAWQTAVQYQLVHAVALLAVTLYTAEKPTLATWLKRACFCWHAGLVLFSGSLYWLALGGPRFLGPITPLGGLLLILGWLCLFGAAAHQTQKPNA